MIQMNNQTLENLLQAFLVFLQKEQRKKGVTSFGQLLMKIELALVVAFSFHPSCCSFQKIVDFSEPFNFLQYSSRHHHQGLPPCPSFVDCHPHKRNTVHPFLEILLLFHQHLAPSSD
jgi:hypothetical protein